MSPLQLPWRHERAARPHQWSHRKIERKQRRDERQAAVRDLYLDLLIRTLTNTIYADPSIGPGRAGVMDPKMREEGQDWPMQAHTMAGTKRLSSLRELVQRALDDGVPGDFIETGVWRGGCCILMRGVLKANRVRNRKVYVADSFQGLPPPRLPEDSGDKHYTRKELAVGIEEVRANFAKYGLLDKKVIFVKGYFQDTLRVLEAGPFALIRLDGDMYDSTIVALDALYPKVSADGYVVIDDYALPACRRAVTDYRERYAIQDPLNTIDWTGVWWQKKSPMTLGSA